MNKSQKASIGIRVKTPRKLNKPSRPKTTAIQKVTVLGGVSFMIILLEIIDGNFSDFRYGTKVLLHFIADTSQLHPPTGGFVSNPLGGD
jgi:hypothetical protein